MRAWPILLCLMLCGLFTGVAKGQVSEEIPTGHAPDAMVREALKSVLGPEGKFVMLERTGTVIVMGTAQQIQEAHIALASLDAPPPRVALNFAFRHGTAVPQARTGNVLGPVQERTDFPVPTEYSPPRVIVSGNGSVTVIPATPVKFRRRNLGQTLEVNPTVNSDDSITLDLNFDATELEGFINYGSAILNSGSLGSIPVSDAVPNPGFFQTFLNNGGVQVPVFGVTRVSTSVVVYPEVKGEVVSLDMIPRLTVTESEAPDDPREFNLRQYRTSTLIPADGPAVIRGLEGASSDFNRYFLGADEETEGSPAIKVEATVSQGAVEAQGETTSSQ